MNSTLKTLKEMGRCFLDEPLARHTTWGVGGPATIFALPKTLDQLVELVGFCESSGMRHIVIGNGSNLLFDDSGFEGVVICTKALAHDNSVRGNTITVGAGETLAKLAQTAYRNGLSGLEWAMGIPGTVGGAVVQNAGAFGKDMAASLSRVLVYENHALKAMRAEDCDFSYRWSRFKESKALILDACFVLRPDKPEEIKNRMKLFASRRIATQPVGRSAGSVFKGTSGFAAGYLIEQCGLKGKQIGGAKISEKHANFILNTGSATSRDIVELVDLCREQVYQKFGVWLESEIERVEGKNESY